MKEISLPDKCLVHRYLYYVENEPIISDMEYDIMEKEARRVAPENHPINKPGSSLKSSYSDYIIKLAEEWKKEK